MKSLSTPLLDTVDRAIAEIRQGGAVLIKDELDATLAFLSAEILSPAALQSVSAQADQPLMLAVTAKRAETLGFPPLQNSTRTVLLTIPNPISLDWVAWIVDPLAKKPDPASLNGVNAVSAPLGSAIDSAIVLLKLARLLPAALVAPLPAKTKGYRLQADSILRYQAEQARTLSQVAEARVPLKDAENARLVAFRPADGGTEHLAIIIGEPDITKPVLIRLHSECFTGDLLGSLRCDCGDQLRGAIAEISQAGSGILLYLAQEGRGIGLINKLRAYQLQDSGFDTMDANLQLGFDDDERIYLPAAKMLSLLGIAQVRLMTNNPLKIEALSKSGIQVVERVPHVFPSNDHNASYLATKASKGGHLF